MYHKILIISHVAANTTNNVGKTIYNIFHDYPKECLRQIYFNPTLPNVDLCEKYINISDMSVLKSIFSKNMAGQELIYTKKDKETSFCFTDSYIYTHSKGRSTNKLILRDIVWHFGKINNDIIEQWMYDFCPDIIFLAPGYSIFAYDLALNLSRKYKLPLFLFQMDDFYNEKKLTKNPLEIIRQKKLRKAIKDCVNHAAVNFVCSQEMANDYEKEFKRKFFVLYTPILNMQKIQHRVSKLKNLDSKNSQNISMIYAGGLGLGRGDLLIKFASVAEKISKKNIEINVYSTVTEKKIINEIRKKSNIHFHGFVDSITLKQKIENCDAILHVESFNPSMLSRTRYSISTKIVDCLSSGKLIIAIGPSTQASIKYLDRYEAALVCTSETSFLSFLNNVVDFDGENAERIISNAIHLAFKNHDSHRVTNEIETLITAL